MYKPTASEIGAHNISESSCPATVMAINDDDQTLSLLVMYPTGTGGGTFAVRVPENSHDDGTWK